MTEPIATFEKVSFEQFMYDYCKIHSEMTSHNEDLIREIWQDIKLPTRATTGSAGYDFYLPTATLFKQEPTVLPTGIRCRMKEGWVLMLFPRSGLGFKYGMALRNTVGVIDSDYFNADNEGHIQASIQVQKDLYLVCGDRFMQGIFLPYGLASNGNLGGERFGGFGSTDGVNVG